MMEGEVLGDMMGAVREVEGLGGWRWKDDGEVLGG